MRFSGRIIPKNQTTTVFATILTLLLVFTHCKTVDLAKELNRRIVDPMDDSRTPVIFFATNRLTGSGLRTCSNATFQSKKGPSWSYGTCQVNVPKRHSVGTIDKASQMNADRDTHFQIGNLADLSESNLLSGLQSAPGEEVLVFIHGFNVRFEEALMRGAQIGYDMKFQGPILVITWPAGAGSGILDDLLISKTYRSNQEDAQESIQETSRLFTLLKTTGKKPHLIVHSMGHQIVIPALKLLADDGYGTIFGEVVFNAPDFPGDDFKQIASDILDLADRYTIYCSPGDNALIASEQLSKQRRLGQCQRVDGMDVINVNAVDAPALGIGGLGHGYYAGRPILTDLYQLILGVNASNRLFLRKSDRGGGEHYIMRP